MSKKINLFSLLLLFGSLFIAGCQSGSSNSETISQESKEENASEATQSERDITEIRIVSLNGTLTEIIAGLGYEDQIVGVDVTSVYPPSINRKPKLGHISGIKVESVAALEPDYVFVRKDELKQELANQLNQLGINLITVDQEFSIAGTKKLIRTISDTLGVPQKAEELISGIDQAVEKVQPIENPPSVLFIYARGPGNLMVAGQNTALQDMIALAGGQNVELGFEDFKPLTPEALVTANPDAILMFSSGKESLEESVGLMAVPGIAQTNAGKNEQFIIMDGLFLSGFGPRVGHAAAELNEKLKAIAK